MHENVETDCCRSGGCDRTCAGRGERAAHSRSGSSRIEFGCAAHGLIGCVLSIMLAAADKGNKYKKELTTDEALTCGLLYWFKEVSKKR